MKNRLRKLLTWLTRSDTLSRPPAASIDIYKMLEESRAATKQQIVWEAKVDEVCTKMERRNRGVVCQGCGWVTREPCHRPDVSAVFNRLDERGGN